MRRLLPHLGVQLDQTGFKSFEPENHRRERPVQLRDLTRENFDVTISVACCVLKPLYALVLVRIDLFWFIAHTRY